MIEYINIMKSLIVANWKMNPESAKEAKALFSAVKKGIAGLSKKIDVVICPPYEYLGLLKGLILGAQNCFYEEKGAYTGEISALMLKNIGVGYVILGHSERRRMGETNEQINKKLVKAIQAGLMPILCVGEKKEEKDQGKKQEVLEAQIKQCLGGITADVVVAYEPVWAIGTGDNCGVDETKESIDFIRKLVKTGTRILYGGSVKSENSGAYIKDSGADGLLVGGASLNAEEFIKIVKSAE